MRWLGKKVIGKVDMVKKIQYNSCVGDMTKGRCGILEDLITADNIEGQCG